MSKSWWGVSFAYDIKSCDKAAITNPEILKKWIIELVDDIQMIRHGEPIIEHFGEPGTDKQGYTIIQLITTSCLTAHFNDLTGDCYFDLFTCKCDVPNMELIIEDSLRKWFKPSSISWEKLYRLA